MPRLPGKPLGIALGALGLAHMGLAVAGARALHLWPTEWQQNLVWLGFSLAVAALGRLFLAFLPPGPIGAHDLRGLSETWATSLTLGWLVIALACVPVLYLWGTLAELGSSTARWLPYGLLAGLLALLGLARVLTLPGAMVPRRGQEREGFGLLRGPLLVALLGWLGFMLFTRAFVPALAWLALALVLERALYRARRAAGGRALFLLVFVLLASPARARSSELYGLFGALGQSVVLGLGAAFLVPWLRRADRRAGLLAALFLGAPFLAGWEPLALVGPLVLVLASRPAQRAFALGAALGVTLPCAAAGLLSLAAQPPRGRALAAHELLAQALDLRTWGLAWPLLLLALGLGALTFPWRAPAWTPGRIEEPRREALALAALLALAGLALAWSGSSLVEGEVLLVLFPPAALLAGLLLIPPESAEGP